MQLALAVLAEILAESVFHVLLGEEYVHALEFGIIGSHAVILQTLDGVHTLFGHILLGEHLGELLGAVVAEVDEDYHIALLDGTVYGRVDDRLYKLVGHAVGVALLHGLNHVGGFLALALDEQVVSLFHAVPSLVAVHGVEAADDAGDVSAVGCAGVSNLLDKSGSALGVGVATVHEAVYEGLVQAILLGDFNQLEEVVERRVYAAS